jgi:hypothetical protein
MAFQDRSTESNVHKSSTDYGELQELEIPVLNPRF